MPDEIITIELPLPLYITTVNSYLIKTGKGFFLVDCGFTSNRRRLEANLTLHGCTPGNLKLILLTHGDFDHTGNAVYLRKKYETRIAMHAGDEGMLSQGDMFYGRKFDNRLMRWVMHKGMPFSPKNRGSADILLDDNQELIWFGVYARAYNTPGHSSGSLCYLTSAGDLFCGDLLTNSTGKPQLNSMLYDKPAGEASLARLKTMQIRWVYPGHGKPFKWNELT